jgi:magnesium transporter
LIAIDKVDRVKAILDANRNSLMLLDLKFSIGTLGIGSGAFVAALYGMNLKNFVEESDLGFWGVSAWSLALTVVVFAYGLKKLRRVQRVSMWGEAGKRGWRGSWRNTEEEMTAGLLEAGQRERGERLRRLKNQRISAMREAISLDTQRLPITAGREGKAKKK